MGVKGLDQVPARIIRLRLPLMRYAPKIEYIPGSRSHIADALSRAPFGLPSRIDVMLVEELEASTFVIPFIDLTIEEIKEATTRCCVPRGPESHHKMMAYI